MCRSYADRCGGEVVAEFADERLSGTLGSRPVVDARVRECPAGRIDVVVVYRPDRRGRSLRQLRNTLAKLDEVTFERVDFCTSLRSVAVGSSVAPGLW